MYKRTAPSASRPKIEELLDDSDEEREAEEDDLPEAALEDVDGEGELEEDLPDQIFQAVTLIIPLTTLFVLMDLCVFLPSSNA